MTAAVWFVSAEKPGLRAEWDWATLGVPKPRMMLPTRHPSSGDFSRHTPRTAWTTTTEGPLPLESGLEHDLVRWVDHRPDVDWIVAQPVTLHFVVPGKRRAVVHTPDLLTTHVDGTVTIWDARASERRDDLFMAKAKLTGDECQRVGWRYEIFDGLPTPHRMNLLWLAGFRRSMPWHEPHIATLGQLAAEPVSIGEVRSADPGSGELIATMWHLIWVGRLACDLTKPMRHVSTVAWVWSDGFSCLGRDGI